MPSPFQPRFLIFYESINGIGSGVLQRVGSWNATRLLQSLIESRRPNAKG